MRKYFTKFHVAKPLGASAYVCEHAYVWQFEEKGRELEIKIRKGRLISDRIGFWSPKTKRIGFHPMNVLKGTELKDSTAPMF